ncbi:MAG: hypothetical protein KAT46_01435 [Deltaproteobacteria bacterium]|nr:hypothetical protein [Deltaproteobacteria bacterium]
MIRFKGFYSLVLLLISFVLVFALPSGAYSEEKPVIVEAEGFARKSSSGEYRTTQLARDEAVKGSVLVALRLFMDEVLLIENMDFIESNILASSSKYVLNYRILYQGWITHYDLPEETEVEETKETTASEGKKTSSSAAADGVPAYHTKVEARVDISTLKKDIKKFVFIEDYEVSDIEIIIFGVEDYKDFEEIKSRLLLVPGIKELSYKSFFRRKTVMTAMVTLPFNEIFNALRKEFASNFSVIPTGGGWGSGAETLILKPILRGGAR